jgi:hypothetical protein
LLGGQGSVGQHKMKLFLQPVIHGGAGNLVGGFGCIYLQPMPMGRLHRASGICCWFCQWSTEKLGQMRANIPVDVGAVGWRNTARCSPETAPTHERGNVIQGVAALAASRSTFSFTGTSKAFT